MSAKLVFLVGVLGIGGYVGMTGTAHDAEVYPYSEAAVREMLASATTAVTRGDGTTGLRVWSPGAAADGVRLRMKYGANSREMSCRAVITPVSDNQTRVVTDCGEIDRSDAMTAVSQEMRVPVFREHVAATLARRSFDRKKVALQEGAVAMKNVPDMQHEALRRADEHQRTMAEMENIQ